MNTSIRFTTTLAILTMATSVFGQRPADDDFPTLPSSLSQLSRSRNSVDETADPFRRASEPLSDYRYQSDRDSRSEQSRYRVPVDSIGYSNRSRYLTDDFQAYPVSEDRFNDRLNTRQPSRYDDRRQDRVPVSNNRRYEDVRPGMDSRINRDRYSNDRDPFIPAPLPDSQMDDEAQRSMS